MILWPTHVRQACLCPRLMVDNYVHHHEHRIRSAGTVFHGRFFHDQVAARMFDQLAGPPEQELVSIIVKNIRDPLALADALWEHLDGEYLSRALEGPNLPKNINANQIEAMANGLGLLSGFLAEMIARQKPFFRSGRKLVQSLFQSPEKKMTAAMTTASGTTFEITGKYDALLFDRQDNEFVILEFKCKNDFEVIGDLEQLALYAWLIRQSSQIPARGAVFYLDQIGEIKRITSEELEAAFEATSNLINAIGQWIPAKDLTQARIPATHVPGLCPKCPLDLKCEQLFGSRRTEEADKLFGPAKTLFPTGPELTDPGIELGRRLDAPGEHVYWNILGPDRSLPNAHMLIVGTSGSGKTQVLKAIIAGIIDRGVTPLIFDFNDDYVGQDFIDRHGIQVVNPLDGLPLNPLVLTPDRTDGTVLVMSSIFELAGILRKVYDLGDQQEANLRTAMEACYRNHGLTRDTRQAPTGVSPGFNEIEAQIRLLPGHLPLLNRLSPIFSLNLFRDARDDQDFAEFITRPTVIRLAPLPTEEVKLAVGEFVLLRLYNYLVTGNHHPSVRYAVVIDEAHKMSLSDAVSKLFREGRKYGLGVILSSQKAQDFHSDVHANAATCLFLKNNELSDRNYIAKTLVGTKKDSKEISESLAMQNAFEAIFRNDDYKPFTRLRISPYFERYPAPTSKS
ncbi:MAG: ATP-binding protein [Deltaproteobacteria bacterium]|nr:ATP-binding protein [Deltaproteobacteria bacterium]